MKTPEKSEKLILLPKQRAIFPLLGHPRLARYGMAPCTSRPTNASPSVRRRTKHNILTRRCRGGALSPDCGATMLCTMLASLFRSSDGPSQKGSMSTAASLELHTPSALPKQKLFWLAARMLYPLPRVLAHHHPEHPIDKENQGCLG